MRTESSSARIWLTALALVVAGAAGLTACSSETPQSLIAAGKQSEAKKDFKAAVVQYKAALQLDPNAAETRLLIGSSLLSAGDPVGAVVELSKALDQKVPPAKVLPALSRALLLTGDYKTLTLSYGDITLEDKAAQAALKVNVARGWGALNDKPKTEAAVAAALAAVPDDGPALILVASLAAGRGEFDKALATLNGVLAKDDTLYEGWMLQGEILLVKNNNRKEAEAAFRKVLTLEKAYLQAHAALVSTYVGDGNLVAAKAQAAELRAMLPQHPQTQFIDAYLSYVDHDLPKANERLQQLLRIVPDNLAVLQLAGVVEAQQGALVLAENHFLKALSINPDLPTARLNLARVYIAVEQPAKGLETLKPLLTAGAGSAEANAVAGDALLRLGDPAGAEIRFNRASQLNPDDVKSRTAVALARLSRGNTSAGFDDLSALAAKSTDTYPDLALVSARLKRSEFGAALAAADNMVKKAPKDARGYEIRGRILLAMKDFPAARAAFEQALKADPNLYAATANLTQLDLKQKQNAQARARLEAGIAADPRNYYLRLLMADVRASSGADMTELRSILNDAIKNAPTAVLPRVQLIELLLRERLFKDALAVAEEASAAFPTDITLLDAAGRAYMGVGNSERAINSFRKIAGLAPTSANPYIRLAVAYRALGQQNMVETAWKKAMELDPASRQVQTGWVEYLLAQRRPGDALKYAAELQRKNPELPDAYVLEAGIQMRAKAPDAAIAALRRGVAAVKGRSDIPLTLYVLYGKTGRDAEAEKFAAEWLKKDPSDAGFELEVGAAASARGDFERAEVHFRHVLLNQPDYVAALNNLAWLLVQQGKPGAVALAQKATDLMPNQAPLLDTLALALVADKRAGEALPLQKRAVELAPGDNAMHLNLAKIALQAGDKALARTELERLRALGDAFKEQDKVSALMKAI